MIKPYYQTQDIDGFIHTPWHYIFRNFKLYRFLIGGIWMTPDGENYTRVDDGKNKNSFL